MPPKRPSVDIEATVIKQGCLIKSPPAYLFSKRASWKGRLLKLCKSELDTYHISYYAFDGVTEELKGSIAVNDINSIELGSNTKDKIMIITRLFNNSPENILCIKTEKRVFYLVDDNEENIADWHKCITDVWVNIHQRQNDEGLRIGNPAMVTPPPPSPVARLSREIDGLAVYPVQSRHATEQHLGYQLYANQAVFMKVEAPRPSSYPVDKPCSESPSLDTIDRERSLTDPNTEIPRLPRKPREPEPPCKRSGQLEPSKVDPTRGRSQTNVDVIPSRHSIKNNFRRFSLPGQEETDNRRKSNDTAYNSDSESIYDTPSLWPRIINSSIDSYDEDNDDSSDDNVYEDMGAACQAGVELNEPMTDSIGQSQSSLDEEGLMKASGEQSPSIMKKLTIPTAHLQEHLDLQEVGDRLCVSKWKGPEDIGCVFHHGDHIEEINGFRPGSKELFFQLLTCATKDKVDLVVIRKKNAGVFRSEGCNCGDS